MRRSTGIITVVLLGLVAAAFFARKQLIRGALPEVEKITAGSIAFFDDSARVKLEVIVRNRGWVSYHLQGISIEVTNDSLVLVHYVSNVSHKLGADETKTFPLEFVVPVKTTLHRIRSIQGQDSTRIAIRGWLNFSTWVGDVKVPVDELFAVEVPIPPEIRVHEIEYLPGIGEKEKNGQGKLYNFRVKASVVNLNKKKFEFQEISYDFYGGELIESHGRLDDISIAPLDSTYFSIPLQVKVDNRAKLLYNIVTDNDVINYTLKMRGTIVSLAGFDQEIPATFSNSGRVELFNPARKKVPISIRKRNGRKN